MNVSCWFFALCVKEFVIILCAFNHRRLDLSGDSGKSLRHKIVLFEQSFEKIKLAEYPADTGRHELYNFTNYYLEYSFIFLIFVQLIT